MSSQVIKDVSDTSERVDEMRYKSARSSFFYSPFKELNNLDIKLTMLEVAHANIEQDLEQLTAQEDEKVGEVTQVLLLETP